MFSLPDLQLLNRRAEERALSERDCFYYARHAVNPETGGRAVCEYESGECVGEIGGTVYYDIFSDDPKGVIFLCEYHDGYYGSPAEGYFYCSGCERVMIENYTWELYHNSDEEEMVCLNCYAQSVIGDDSQWLVLTKERIANLGFGDVRRSKHIFAVSGPRHGLEHFGDSVLFDSMTGGTVIGFSSTDTPNRGVNELKETLEEARRAGYRRALLVMDGAYQFCASIAVYVKPKRRTK